MVNRNNRLINTLETVGVVDFFTYSLKPVQCASMSEENCIGLCGKYILIFSFIFNLILKLAVDEYILMSLYHTETSLGNKVIEHV